MDTVPGADDTAIHNEDFGTLRYDTDVDPENQTIDAFIGTGGGETLNPSRLQFEDGTTLDVDTNFTLGIVDDIKYLVLFPSVGGATLIVDETITGGQWIVRAGSLVTAGAINPDNAVWLIAGEVRTVNDMMDATDMVGTASQITANAGGVLQVGTDGSGDMLASSITADRIGANLGSITVADNVSAYTKFTVDGGTVTADTAGADPNGVGVGQLTIENDGTLTVTSELRLPAGGSGQQVIVYGDVDSALNTADVHDLNFVADSSVIHPPGGATAPSLRLEISGDLNIATTSMTLEAQWDATGVDVVLDGSSAQEMEAISTDFGIGNDPWMAYSKCGEPFDFCYTRPWSSLTVGADATVEVVDANVNAFRGTNDAQDAVYVDGPVTVVSGGELDTGSFVVFHTGTATGNIVGTHQQKVKRCYGDFDDDGDVDPADFAIFAQAFAGPNNTPNSAVADADCDHDVDLADFAIFGQNQTGSNQPCPNPELPECPESLGFGGWTVESLAEWCLEHLSTAERESFAETLLAAADAAGETQEAADMAELAYLITAE